MPVKMLTLVAAVEVYDCPRERGELSSLSSLFR
jgi:hypothetical protein